MDNSKPATNTTMLIAAHNTVPRTFTAARKIKQLTRMIHRIRVEVNPVALTPVPGHGITSVCSDLGDLGSIHPYAMTFLFFSSLFAGPSVHYQNKESQEVSQWISTVVHGQGHRREPWPGSKRFSARREVEIVLRLYAVKTWNCFPGNSA